MVRNYNRKSDKGFYSKKQLQEAVRAVQNGSLSGYKASKLYQIPRMTIMDHVHKKRGKSKTLGRSTALSLETEKNLASCLHTMEKNGFGLSREEVLSMVGDYVSRNEILTPFKNGIPGKDWLYAFQKRHNLSIKKPQAVEYARKKAVNPYLVYPYFDLLQKTLEDLGLKDKPSSIWNLDETCFSKDPSKTKIIGLKGHAATRIISTPGKDNTTVLLGANAIGEKTPPLIIFKGKNVWDEWTSPNAFPGTTYAATKNGWMETEVFETFFKKSFLPTVGNQRPILLIYDGHSTHVGLNLIQEARKSNVTILKLPAHTSHILQPLDVAVMKSFKDRWDPLLVKWQRMNVGKPLPKKEFARLIGLVWEQIDPQVLCNGFRKSGIYPFNPSVISEDKFDALKLQSWKEFMSTSERLLRLQNLSLINNNQSTTNYELPHNGSSNELVKLNTNITKMEPKTLSSIVLNVLNKIIIFNNYEVSNGKNLQDKVQEKNDLKFDQIIGEKCVTFEELLLEKVKLGDHTKIVRRKVATGAEVITHDEVVNLKSEEQQRKLQKENKKKKLKVESILLTQHNNVVRLCDVSNSDTDLQAFIARNTKELPRCLQKQKSELNKIQILSDTIVKSSTKPNEEYLLAEPGSSGINKMKDKSNKTRNKFAESYKIYPKNQPTVTSFKGKGIGKKSGKENKIPFTQIEKTDNIISYKEKKEIHSFSSKSSTTSVSGSMSIHSDSDLMTAGSGLDEIDALYDINDYVLVRYFTKKWTYYVGVIEHVEAQNKETYYSVRFYKTVKKPKLVFKQPRKIDRDVVPEISIVKKVNLAKDPTKLNDYILVDDDDVIYF